jgi:hypothetical protein
MSGLKKYNEGMGVVYIYEEGADFPEQEIKDPTKLDDPPL